jgi:hypothetical protein
MKLHLRDLALVSLTGAICLAIACGTAKSNNTPPVGYGQLAVDLVDAPNPAVEEIWVKVTQVRAHSTSAGWTTVSNTTLPVDLLKLQTYAAPLGLANLPPGTVTQIRLLLAQDGNYVVTGGKQVPLKVPSGCESGVKIQGPWEVAACNRTSVTLDFDGNKSIWYHPTGQGDEWILRPVIHVRKSDSASVGCSDGGGGTPDGGSGAPCGAGNPACPEGLTCIEATCRAGQGAPCTLGSQCVSGSCDGGNRCGPGGTGSPCLDPAECLSGTCTAGKCQAGGPGLPCRSGTDCQSGSCTSEATCAPGAAGGTGATCGSNAECLSSSCAQGKCEPGGQGAPCAGTADCGASWICVGGFCAPPPL